MQSQVKQRNPIAVLILSFITFGIYDWYWLVKVKGELNRSQNSVNIPTAWVWVIPVIGTIWYEWKFSEATDIVTSGKYSSPVTFMLLFVLGPIGYAILQDGYNKSGSIATAPEALTTPATTTAPVMPTAPTTPTAPFTTVASSDTVAPATSTVPTTSVTSTSSTNPFETVTPANSTNPFEATTPVAPAAPTTPANPFTPADNSANQNVDDTNFFNR